MQSKEPSTHKTPDIITEELLNLFSRGDGSYGFQEIFSIIHDQLKDGNEASGGEEMLRLRTHEKLQELIERNLVKQDGEKYRGVGEPETTLPESSQPLPDTQPVPSIWQLFLKFHRSVPGKRRDALEELVNRIRQEMRSESISMISIVRLWLCILILYFLLVARFYRMSEESSKKS